MLTCRLAGSHDLFRQRPVKQISQCSAVSALQFCFHDLLHLRFFDTGALCALLDGHRAGKTNAMTKIWAFYCFIEWYEVYFVEQKPPIL